MFQADKRGGMTTDLEDKYLFEEFDDPLFDRNSKGYTAVYRNNLDSIEKVFSFEIGGNEQNKTIRGNKRKIKIKS